MIEELGQIDRKQSAAQRWYWRRLREVAGDLARRDEIMVALQSVDQKHMNIMDKAALGIIPDDILLPYIERIRTERDQLLGELDQLATEPEEPVIQHDVAADLISFLSAGITDLTCADPRLSRLRELIHRVTLNALPAPSKF